MKISTIKKLIHLCNKKKWYKKSSYFLNRLALYLDKNNIWEHEYSSFLINEMIPLLDKLYSDNYHLEIYHTDNDSNRIIVSGIGLIIRFEKVIVTNEQDNSTILHEFFIKKTFSNYLSCRQDIHGTLINPTIEQYLYNYHHSHISSYSYDGNFNSFCTGSDTTTRELLGFNGPSTSNIDELESMLLFLEVFVKTESLEGGPHIRLNNLKSGSMVNSTDSSNQASLELFKGLWKSKKIDYPVNWKIENGQYIVIDDESLEQYCTDVIENSGIYNDTCTYQNMFCLKDGVGNYYKNSKNQLSNIDEFEEKEPFEFQDKLIPFKIISDNISLNKEKLFINPIIINYVKQQLERKFKKQLLTDYCKNNSKRKIQNY